MSKTYESIHMPVCSEFFMYQNLAKFGNATTYIYCVTTKLLPKILVGWLIVCIIVLVIVLYTFYTLPAPNFGNLAYFMFSPIGTDTPAMMPTKCCLISETDNLTSTSPSFESCLACLNILYLRLKCKTDSSCCVCVCCVKGHKKDLKPSLFLKAIAFTQSMHDSAPFVLLLLLCDGRDVK